MLHRLSRSPCSPSGCTFTHSFPSSLNHTRFHIAVVFLGCSELESRFQFSEFIVYFATSTNPSYCFLHFLPPRSTHTYLSSVCSNKEKRPNRSFQRNISCSGIRLRKALRTIISPTDVLIRPLHPPKIREPYLFFHPKPSTTPLEKSNLQTSFPCRFIPKGKLNPRSSGVSDHQGSKIRRRQESIKRKNNTSLNPFLLLPSQIQLPHLYQTSTST